MKKIAYFLIISLFLMTLSACGMSKEDISDYRSDAAVIVMSIGEDMAVVMQPYLDNQGPNIPPSQRLDVALAYSRMSDQEDLFSEMKVPPQYQKYHNTMNSAINVGLIGAHDMMTSYETGSNSYFTEGLISTGIFFEQWGTFTDDIELGQN